MAGGLEDRERFSGLWSVTTFAICAKLNSVFDSRVVSVQTVTDTTARTIFSVDCAAGMNLTGGAAFAGSPGAVVEVVSPNTTGLQVIARFDGTVTPADAWNVVGRADPHSLTTDRALLHERVITHTPSDEPRGAIAEGDLASL